MDASNVSTGKPKVTGALFVAPAGTANPTNATAALDGAFVNLGYASEDGLTNNIETDTNDTKAWGGATVLTTQTSYKETFSVGLIETKESVLAQFYGAENVSVDGSGNITVNHTAVELPEQVLVIETVLASGKVRRTVVPKAKISDRSAEIAYNDGDAITYPMMWDTAPDANGNTAVEFIAAVAESA